MITAELISTGNELLSGRTLNRHGQVLGDMLRRLSIQLVQDTTVGDDPEIIARCISEAMQRVPLVFVSGGLGPTSDDLTREALALALGRNLVPDAGMLAKLEAHSEKRGWILTEARKRQALVIEGAEVLPNPVGICAGQRIEDDGTQLFVLPGPPREFIGLMESAILPWLVRHLPDRTTLYEKIFLFSGTGESEVHHKMDVLQLPPDGVAAAYCAAPGRVEMILSTREKVQDLEHCAEAVRKHLGRYLYAEERTALECVVGDLLKQQQALVAVAESCTGGLLGGRLTAVPGSSAWFRGGVIAYANAVKTDILGVRPQTLEAHGAVSEPAAKEMAKGVCAVLGADYGVSITGVAGPDGGTAGKPVGLVYIGVAHGEQVVAKPFNFGGDRIMIRELAVQRAMDLLRQCVLGTLE